MCVCVFLVPAGEPSGVSVHVASSDRLLPPAGLRPAEPPVRPYHPVRLCDGGTDTHSHRLTHTHAVPVIHAMILTFLLAAR